MCIILPISNRTPEATILNEHNVAQNLAKTAKSELVQSACLVIDIAHTERCIIVPFNIDDLFNNSRSRRNTTISQLSFTMMGSPIA